MGRWRTQGERRAVRRFADAVRTEAERFLDALIEEEVRRTPEILRLRSEPMLEEEATAFALDAVHRARDEAIRMDEFPRKTKRLEGWRVATWARDRDKVRAERPAYWGLTKDETKLRPYEPPLIVLDTGIVVSALVGPEASPHIRFVDEVIDGSVRLAWSHEFLHELSRVAGYPDVERQISSTARALHFGLYLAAFGEMHTHSNHDWPGVEDPKDGWILDLAWDVKADYIVSVDPHLTQAPLPFPVEVIEPQELLSRLPHAE